LIFAQKLMFNKQKLVIMAEKDVKKRVQDAMNKVGITAYAIAKSCSINERTVYQQITGSSKLGVETIEAFLRLSPDVSAEWLLRGSGSMLLSEPQHETLTGEIRNDNETIAALKETIAAQKIAIDALTDQVKVLKGDIVVPHRSAATA